MKADMNAVVLTALEAANRVHERPVRAREVLECIEFAVMRQMMSRYAKKPIEVTASFLETLARRELIDSMQADGQRRYYAARSIRFSASAIGGLPVSERQRVLRLVRTTAAKLGRAVRADDIVRECDRAELGGLTHVTVQRSMASLVQEGELTLCLSGAGYPRRWFIPSDFDPARYGCPQATSMTDRLLQIFQQLWREHLEAAAGEGVLPTALTTGEITQRYISQFGDGTTNTIGQRIGSLADRGCGIRRIRRPNGALLWAPLDCLDSSIAIAHSFATDFERLAEAVARSSERLSRPVTAKEAEEEANADPRLRLAGKLAYRFALSSAARNPRGKGGQGGRPKRSLFHLGRIGQHPYYCVENAEQGLAYVRFHILADGWKGWKATARPEEICKCQVESIAAGRVLLARDFVTRARRELQRILSAKVQVGAVQGELTALDEEMSRTMELVIAVQKRLRTVLRSLPPKVIARPSGWSLNEVWNAIRLAHPSRTKKPATMEGFIKSIRRVSDFGEWTLTRTRHRDVRYDPTDTLIYAALRWGGHEATIHGSICHAELGDLRDDRFVLPGLASRDFEARLAAVSCGAFLQSTEIPSRLRELALKDTEPAVRDAAVWAFGFSGGPNAHQLVREVSWDSSLLREAREAQSEVDWWRL